MKVIALIFFTVFGIALVILFFAFAAGWLCAGATEPTERTEGTNCGHRYTYYSEEHDNWYCAGCRQGMGEDYYNAHRNEIPNL